MFKRKRMEGGGDKPKARVRIYGHGSRTQNAEGVDLTLRELVSEFTTEANMHRADYEKPRGACFFVYAVDYPRELSNGEFRPRSAPAVHLLVTSTFSMQARCGIHFTCPYGGAIDIEAV